MNLSFKEWFITEWKRPASPKRKVSVQPGMKQWVASVENLEKELEILKDVLKTKKDKEEKLKADKKKEITQKINVIDKKLDVAKDKKPEPEKDKKPEDKHELPIGKDQSPKPIRPSGEYGYSSLRKQQDEKKKNKPDKS